MSNLENRVEKLESGPAPIKGCEGCSGPLFCDWREEGADMTPPKNCPNCGRAFTKEDKIVVIRWL